MPGYAGTVNRPMRSVPTQSLDAEDGDGQHPTFLCGFSFLYPIWVTSRSTLVRGRKAVQLGCSPADDLTAER